MRQGFQQYFLKHLSHCSNFVNFKPFLVTHKDSRNLSELVKIQNILIKDDHRRQTLEHSITLVFASADVTVRAGGLLTAVEITLASSRFFLKPSLSSFRKIVHKQ